MNTKSKNFLNFLKTTENLIKNKKLYIFKSLLNFIEDKNNSDADYKILSTQIRTMTMIDLLIRTESLLKGHFELSSGLHSNQYFQCARLLQYPEYAEKAGKQLAALFDTSKIDVVLGPAMGGVIIGYETAKSLGKKSIFTERKDGIMTLRRGFHINKGDRVLVIEDVITTAKSTIESIKIIESFGGKIAGIGCIVDRSKGQTPLVIKSLIQIDPEIYSPEECPMCKLGQSIEKPGSRTQIIE